MPQLFLKLVDNKEAVSGLGYRALEGGLQQLQGSAAAAVAAAAGVGRARRHLRSHVRPALPRLPPLLQSAGRRTTATSCCRRWCAAWTWSSRPRGASACWSSRRPTSAPARWAGVRSSSSSSSRTRLAVSMLHTHARRLVRVSTAAAGRGAGARLGLAAAHARHPARATRRRAQPGQHAAPLPGQGGAAAERQGGRGAQGGGRRAARRLHQRGPRRAAHLCCARLGAGPGERPPGLRSCRAGAGLPAIPGPGPAPC
jgi:hypothetical protein